MPIQFPVVKIDYEHFYPQIQATDLAISRMKRQFRDFRKPLRRSVREVLVPGIKLNFAVEGRPPWVPLAPATVRRRKGSAHPILIRTGLMRRRSTQINVWDVDKKKAWPRWLDFKATYAKYHQGGTKHMPARPIMMWHEEEIQAIEEIFLDWMEDVARRWSK